MPEYDRISKIETDLQGLLIDNATLGVSVTHLSKAVDTLSISLHELKSTIDKGRGALFVIVGASSLLGAAMSALLSKIANLSVH